MKEIYVLEEHGYEPFALEVEGWSYAVRAFASTEAAERYMETQPVKRTKTMCDAELFRWDRLNSEDYRYFTLKAIPYDEN